MVTALLSLALAGEPVEVVRSGTVRERVVQDDADLVIFYASEHKGDLGTCGCDVNPRGGLARLDGYLQAVERLGPGTPSILLHAGWWASDRIGLTVALRDDALVLNRGMLEGIDLVDFDALNLTFRDAPWIREHPIPVRALSANAGAGVARTRTVDAGGRPVLITGVGRPGSPTMQPDGATWGDPVAAVREVLSEAPDDAVVVVLAYDIGSSTEALARLEGVDIVIEAGRIAGKLEPWDRQALWVQARDGGQSLGELRLWFDGSGEIERYRDRWVDLDEMVPETPSLRRLERRVERDRRSAMREAGLAE